MIGRTIRKLRRACGNLEKVRHLPDPTFDCVQLALAYFIRSGLSGTFVQVGACDGKSGDPVHGLVASGKIPAVLLEPISPVFQRLEQAYKGVPNLTLVQAAIGDSDGQLVLYKVKQGGHSIDPFWAAQIASFDKQHLIKHGVEESEIEEVTVPCLTLETLMSRWAVRKIGFLQIDAEGYDAEIVRMALRLDSPPEFINFENVHLSEGSAIDDLFCELSAAGYSWMHDKWNTLALQQSVVSRWTSIDI